MNDRAPDRKRVRQAVVVGCIGVAVAYGLALMTRPANEIEDAVTSYKVRRIVRDFPEEEDPSTPEAIYAAINRLSAAGDQESWRRLSVRRFAQSSPAGQGRREVPVSARDEWLNAEILEVRVFRGAYACVIAQVAHPWKGIYDYRSLELEDGRWRNAGNAVFGSLEDARNEFAESCNWRLQQDNSQEATQPSRP